MVKEWLRCVTASGRIFLADGSYCDCLSVQQGVKDNTMKQYGLLPGVLHGMVFSM